MRSTLFVLSVLALLLAGCASQQAPPVAVGTPTPSAQQPAAIQPAEPKNALDALPADIRAVVETGRGRLASGYGYKYTKMVDSKLVGDAMNFAVVRTKGDTRKATLVTPVQIAPDFRIYTIVFDDRVKTASAFCKERLCDGLDAAKLRMVSYDTYTFTTPSDWLAGLTKATKTGEEMLSGRSTLKLDVTVNGQSATMWLDRYSGLPLQVDVGTTRYAYTDLALGVNDKDLQP